MENYREYCVVAVDRSKWGNKYKELFRGRRKDCKRFITAYCEYRPDEIYEYDCKTRTTRIIKDEANGECIIVIGCVVHRVCIKEVKGDNAIYNTIDTNDRFYKDDWKKFFDRVSDFKTEESK